MVVIVGEYLFSGISGSTAADISAIGSLLIAPMERAGYSKGEAVAIVSAATAMGILVPPCIFMIVLASMTNQSIGAMFVAGFPPAIVIALGLGVYIYWKAGKLGIPREARASWGERWRALGDGVIAMVMPGIGILIIASIGIGVFLPPIGVALFIACAIARLSIVESTKYMAPYLVILFLGLLVITYIPWFTLVLPRLFLR